MFYSLRIYPWRQFGDVCIEFDDRLTILTGANGSGKTTILRLLASQLGWKFEFLGADSEEIKVRRKTLRLAFEGSTPRTPPTSTSNSADIVGELTFADCQTSQLLCTVSTGGSQVITVKPSRKIDGLFVPSHRPLPSPLPVKEIPTKLEAKQQLFERYVSAYQQLYASGVRSSTSKSTPLHRIKSSLISLATFGYGNPAMAPDTSAVQTYEDYQNVLSRVLPASLGFQKLQLSASDVFLVTKGSTFSIDAASGGILSIIDLAWQLTLCSTLYEQFTVIIDEPENHLHPQMQRTLLASFLDAFPNAQFVVATHSPLIIGSSADSNVYVLRHDENFAVQCEELDLLNRAGTSNEILRSVLDVPVTMPVWAENKLAAIIQRHSGKPLDDVMLRSIRSEMEAIGIDDVFPETVARVVEDTSDSD